MAENHVSTEDGETSDKSLVPCPSVDWVHNSLMDEYLQLSKDPRTSFKKESTGWNLDFYKLDNGVQQLRVDVERGKDPHNVADVKVLGKRSEDSSISDFYRDGTRWRATFNHTDAQTGEVVARGRADFSFRGADAHSQTTDGYIAKLSGGITEADGSNLYFSSQFDDHGHLTDFETIKPGESGYTPGRCK